MKLKKKTLFECSISISKIEIEKEGRLVGGFSGISVSTMEDSNNFMCLNKKKCENTFCSNVHCTNNGCDNIGCSNDPCSNPPYVEDVPTPTPTSTPTGTLCGFTLGF